MCDFFSHLCIFCHLFFTSFIFCCLWHLYDLIIVFSASTFPKFVGWRNCCTTAMCRGFQMSRFNFSIILPFFFTTLVFSRGHFTFGGGDSATLSSNPNSSLIPQSHYHLPHPLPPTHLLCPPLHVHGLPFLLHPP